MVELAGTPSDEIPEILAEGRSTITTIFASMSARHPQGLDADYLRWHTYDCRPEQHRLPTLEQSLRLVSTPACRAARAASEGSYDSVDHVMTYFFAGLSGLQGFANLTEILRANGRKPYMDGRSGPEEEHLLPQIEMGLYRVDGRAAASRVKVGADVLPWWPLTGAYLLVERGEAPRSELIEVDGVAGAWWGSTVRDEPFSQTAGGMAYAPVIEDMGLRITYCFLDDDPVATAERLRPVLEKRWVEGIEPLLAAPFHPVAGFEYDRHLP
jgi:hypothetical protein